MAARVGKIARLPVKIREELNQRLLDGQSGGKILPWLNALPEVKKILGEDFDSLIVTDMNLSDWRKGGFEDWQKKRDAIHRTRELAEYAAQQSRAGGASIADGAAAIASGKLLELLEVVDEATGAKLDSESLVNISRALAALRGSEQTDVKLKLEKKKISQKDREIDLDEQRYQRDTCALFLKWHTEKNALDVATSDLSNADKIEHLGQLMFGETWKAAKP